MWQASYACGKTARQNNLTAIHVEEGVVAGSMATAVKWSKRATPRCNASVPRTLLPSSPPKLQPASANSEARYLGREGLEAPRKQQASPVGALTQKLEVVELLRQKTRHNVIAERYICRERTVSNTASSKKYMAEYLNETCDKEVEKNVSDDEKEEGEDYSGGHAVHRLMRNFGPTSVPWKASRRSVA